MNKEDIEIQFQEIAKKSQPLFEEEVIVSRASSPLGTYITPKTFAKREILPELDINLDIISKVSKLLIVHDIIKEYIFKYQKEKRPILITIQKELIDLSVIEEFRKILEELNKLLQDVESKTYLYPFDIEKYNREHPDTTFILELNKILQELHSISLEILQEYNMITETYITKEGIEETKMPYFSIGSVRILNIEPYNITKEIIDFINVFNQEVKKTGYATYLNVLYMNIDKKYRLDFTLGAAFDHRSLIIYDPNITIDTFEHIYVDGNHSRTLAWKKYLSDFSIDVAKAQIYTIEKRKEITKTVTLEGEEVELERSLAWRDSLFKANIPKDFLLDMVMVIYLINWDGAINYSSKRDIMSPEDEADIIYNYGLAADYDEEKKHYTAIYDRKTQNVIRAAIKDTVQGIEKVLLPDK